MPTAQTTMTTAGRLHMAVILASALIATAQAQPAYPVKSVRIVVPFPAGGPTDVVMRVLAPRLSEALGHPVMIENRGGAGGTIGTEVVAKSAPDGYTVLAGTVGGLAVSPTLNPRLGYSTLRDLAPVTQLVNVSYIVTLHPSVPAKSLRELLALAKSRPDKLNYGTAGTGTGPHLAGELMNMMASVKIVHVPYKGTIAALNDLFGGQIHFIIGSLPALIPQVKANRLRGIGVTTAKRAAALPDVPAIAEILPGYEAVNWGAVWGPKGLPPNIVARWNSEINRILLLPDIKERLAANGMEPTGGSPERLREILRRDVAKWQSVVKTAGIKTAD